jgi:arginase family enzyme
MFEASLKALEIDRSTYAENTIGKLVRSYVAGETDWEAAHMAIIGIPDGRNSNDNQATSEAPSTIRHELYKLQAHKQDLNMVDLGDLRIGKSPADTLAAMEFISAELIKESVIPIWIGGSMSNCFAQYTAFKDLSRNVECSIVSPKIEVEGDGYIRKISLFEPNVLFNLNVLGFQSHYVNNESVTTIHKMYFNTVRLGKLRSQIQEIEPVLRNTDVFAFDIGAIKHADAPGNGNSNPNGLLAEEACQLCYYAGVSEKMRSFGVYDCTPSRDVRKQTSKLAAQRIWYFVDGYYHRKGDLPGLHSEFVKYRCTMEDKSPDIIFFKSKRTNRWWMEIPDPKSFGNTGRNIQIPCSYADYELATRGEMPDRFWEALQKMTH